MQGLKGSINVNCKKRIAYLAVGTAAQYLEHGRFWIIHFPPFLSSFENAFEGRGSEEEQNGERYETIDFNDITLGQRSDD